MRLREHLRTPATVSVFCVAALIGAAIVTWFLWKGRTTWGLPYHDSFSSGSASEWIALRGTWQIANAAMRNDSDERGAKLLTGSPKWRDYSFSADVELLGKQGDAGLILRSSNEESGVDSYSGYYVGLRGNDDQLLIGRADYGWIQLATRSMPGGVHAFQWYHLRAVVHGCQITAYANEIPGGPMQTLSFSEGDCLAEGRIGLRSHSSGGVWRNLAVLPLSPSDLSLTPPVPYASPTPMPYPPLPMPYAVDEPVTVGQREAEARSPGRRSTQAGLTRPGTPIPIESIGGLRSVRTKDRVTAVRGAVILNSPRLYVQDATGGVEIMLTTATNLKVGDEVEVTGEVEVHDFSCTLRHATIRLLWAHAPAPPLAVTATQAATGAFDSRFIEVDGSLAGESAGPGDTLVLVLRSGSQSFHAIVNPTRGNVSLRGLTKRSLLRIRGVGVVDSQYTHNMTPFVLLVASSDDVEVLAGPPWWSLRNLVIIGLVSLTLGLLAYLLYLHARHWRLRAIVQERERIAHEMHDTLAQSFVGIGFQLQAISNSVPASLPNINAQLDLACELVRHSHEEATRSLTTLRREFVETETLHSALYQFAARMVEHGTISVQVDTIGEDTATPFVVKDALFRIGQEAISNVVRHSHPTVLRIQMQYASSSVTMNIEDNGTGFDYTSGLRGFGLTGMRKRAERILATFSLFTGVGQGTRIQVVAPLPPKITWLNANRYFWRDSREGAPNGKGTRPNPYSYRR
jgi:signal transduction histidine kinase